MKRPYVLPLAAIGVGLVLFNVIAFVVPHASTPSFWFGYAFTTLAILAQVVSLKIAFDHDRDLELTFLGLSVAQISGLYLALQLVFGFVCMFVPGIPVWVCVVVSAILFAGYAMAVIAAVSGKELVRDTGEQVKARTLFIRSLTVDLENLGDRIEDPQLSQAVSKLHEVVRYSDPMSADELIDIESEISIKFAELQTCVTDCEIDKAVRLCAEIERLCVERNRKCKLLK